MHVINKTCPGSRFPCNNGRCIFPRYACDGYPDCPDGSDETIELCGNDPCHGRISCKRSGRCIPMSWCCHRPASLPEGPYDCDIWQRKLCCSRPSLTPDDFDKAFLDSFRSSGIVLGGKQNAMSSQSPSQSNNSCSFCGTSATLAVVAGCIVMFLAFILFAGIMCVKFALRKYQRQPANPSYVGERGTLQLVRNRLLPNRWFRDESSSAPSSSTRATGTELTTSNPSFRQPCDYRRAFELNCENNSAYWQRHNRSRCTGSFRYHHIGCTLSGCPLRLSASLPLRQNLPSMRMESPPPSYSDITKFNEPPPPYADLTSHDSMDDAGLPRYDSVLELEQRNRDTPQ